jgi:hypothetical protein
VSRLSAAREEPAEGWVVEGRAAREALFLALDANFRMKRKDVSSEADDPSLGDGMAFFSQVDEYMRHLESHWDLEQEVRFLHSVVCLD